MNSSTDASEAYGEKFPITLMRVLECKQPDNSIGWCYEGRAFFINPHQFPKKLMPMWFKGIKFNSFIRKLNRWGFRRLRKDETCDSICIFHHPMFNRFGLDAVERMTITKKGRSTTSSSASIKKEQQGEHHTLMLANSTLTATSRLPIIAPQDHRSRETYRRTATSETGIAVLHTLKIQALTQERIKALLLANHLNQLLTERALRCSPRAMSRTHIGGAEFR